MNDDANTFRIFNKNNQTHNFNAFVLGNSKTLAFLSVDWKKHIGQEHRVFKMGSPGESLLNIRKKLEYADVQGNHIDFAILILDRKVLKNTNNLNPEFSGPVYLKGPKSSNNNYLDYIGKGFYYFLYDGFFISYLKGIISSKNNKAVENKEPEHKWSFIEQYMTRDDFESLSIGNEFYRWDTEYQIESNPEKWIEQPPSTEIKANINPAILDSRDSMHLLAIKALFDKHNTSYKIIFGPEYSCLPINIEVVKAFESIFGSQYVSNFTSDLIYCNKPLNFYEPNHYRPQVGKQILDHIYYTN